ncbi:MAG: hypothetical protein ABI779_07420 [Acidobacteriota bacterium]
MGTLNVTFRGICTHFHHGFIRNVPHRVVMPNAASVRFGKVRIPRDDGDPYQAAYYTTPHFAFIAPSPRSDVSKAGSFVVAGARVTVENATPGQPMHYDPSFGSIDSLGDFVTDYEPSGDVVLGERAACHFDVQGGSIRADSSAGVPIVRLQVETDGPPRLLVQPFRTDAFAPVTLKYAGGDTSITLANLEIDRGADVASFDYLLHYLSDRRGIPIVLRKALPGMGTAPPSQTPDDVASALQRLALFLDPSLPQDESESESGIEKILEEILNFDVTPSCADSRFP